jgi:hypothetical protein
MVGDDQAEDSVAQELEALVGLAARRLRTPGAVGESKGQEGLVCEAAAETLPEELMGGVLCQDAWPRRVTT